MLYHVASKTEYQSTDAFRAAHPHTSFGELDDPAYCKALGLLPVIDTPPDYDRDLQVLVPAGVRLAGSTCTRTYAVQEKQLTPADRAAILIRRAETALDAHFDAVARQRRFDNRHTCALRAGYPGPYQTAALAFAQWMDSCNVLAASVLAEVQAGRELPADPAELIATLPAMRWPD